MCVHVAHLVLVALGHANDEIVDNSSHGAEGSDIFPCTVVQLDVDYILLRMGEGD